MRRFKASEKRRKRRYRLYFIHKPFCEQEAAGIQVGSNADWK